MGLRGLSVLCILATFLVVSLHLVVCVRCDDGREHVSNDLNVERPLIELSPLSRKKVHIPRDASDVDSWLLHGDVASYLSLRPIDQVNLPIPVNVVFLGFDGDGEQGLLLDSTQYNEWFRHIAHSFRHTVVPVGEEQTTTDRRPTNATGVTYALDLRVVKMSPLVHTILEDLVYWHTHPEDPSYTRDGVEHAMDEPGAGPVPPFAMDVHAMMRVLHHLVDSVGLNDTHTLFVFNPKKPIHPSLVYGYRTGFSQQEMLVVQTIDEDAWQEALGHARGMDGSNGDGNGGGHGGGGFGVPHTTEYPSGIPRWKPTPSTGTRSIDLTRTSGAWASWYVEQMIKGGANVPYLCRTPDPEDPVCLNTHTNNAHQNVLRRAANMAVHGTQSQKEYIRRVRAGEAQENCLVDVWAGNRRVAFIDLSAGPFHWGPVVTGEGVRSYSTIPRVPPFEAREDEEAFLRSFSSSDASTDGTGSHSLHRMHAGHDASGHARTPSNHAWKQVQLLQAFLSAKCGGDAQENPWDGVEHTCDAAKEALREATQRHDESLMGDAQNAGGEDAPLPSHGGGVPGGGGGGVEGAGASVLMDAFLSDLGALMSRTMESLLMPPVPLFHTMPGQRVTFALYHVGDGALPRDVMDPLKSGLLQLGLPHQHVSFVSRSLPLGKDHALRTAIAHAMRTDVIPTLDVLGAYHTDTVRYIDSMDLQKSLRRLGLGHQPSSSSSTTANGDGDGDVYESLRERYVPVVVISFDNATSPIMVDRFHQAKALEDVVLAVRTPRVQKYVSRVACSGKPIYWNLSNPVRPLLGAVALRYAGLVPPHVGYDEAQHRAAQWWLWSVGDGPMAHTCPEDSMRFSMMAVDVAHRSMVVAGVREAMDVWNDAVHALRRVSTSPGGWEARQHTPYLELSARYGPMHHMLGDVASALSTLDMERATQASIALVAHARETAAMARTLCAVLEVAACNHPDVTTPPQGPIAPGNTQDIPHQRTIGISKYVVAAIVVDVLLFAVYMVFRGPKRVKVKQR